MLQQDADEKPVARWAFSFLKSAFGNLLGGLKLDKPPRIYPRMVWSKYITTILDYYTCSYYKLMVIRTCSCYVLEVLFTEARSSTSFQTAVACSLAEGSLFICISPTVLQCYFKFLFSLGGSCVYNGWCKC